MVPEIDEPVRLERGGQKYYYHAAALGTVTEITDSDGDVVEQYRYDVYGEPAFKDGSGNPISGSAMGNHLLFQGRDHDPDTGLYNFRYRYYSPALGRFLQVDPIGNPSFEASRSVLASIGREGQNKDSLDTVGNSLGVSRSGLGMLWNIWGSRYAMEETSWEATQFQPVFARNESPNLYAAFENDGVNGFDPYGLTNWRQQACRIGCASLAVAGCCATVAACAGVSFITVGGAAIPCVTAAAIACGGWGAAGLSCSLQCQKYFPDRARR